MKISLVVATFAAFAAVGFVHAEVTPSLRGLAEPVANIAPGAPQTDAVAKAGRPCNMWNNWCQGKPRPIVSDPTPEARSAEADADKLAAGVPNADEPSGIILSPDYCQRHPMAPSCDTLRVGSEYCDRHPFAPTCDRTLNGDGAEKVAAGAPHAVEPSGVIVSPDYCQRHPMAPSCDIVNLSASDRAD